jgi:cell division protein DivIC
VRQGFRQSGITAFRGMKHMDNRQRQYRQSEPVSIEKYRKRSKKPLQALNKKVTRLFMVLIPATAVLLSAMALYFAHDLSVRTEKYRQQAEELQEQIAEENQRTEDLEEYQDYVESDEFVELYARSHLGLLKDNEISIRGE